MSVVFSKFSHDQCERSRWTLESLDTVAAGGEVVEEVRENGGDLKHLEGGEAAPSEKRPLESLDTIAAGGVVVEEVREDNEWAWFMLLLQL